MLTRNQRYAADVFRQVQEEIATRDKAYRDKYGSMAHKLPVLIRTAGLAQALAFAYSRNVAEHQKLLDHIAQVVGQTDGDSLVRSSRETHQLADYMRLTRDVLAALLWYKRFAQSVLGILPGGEAGGGDSQ